MRKNSNLIDMPNEELLKRRLAEEKMRKRVANNPVTPGNIDMFTNIKELRVSKERTKNAESDGLLEDAENTHLACKLSTSRKNENTDILTEFRDDES